MSNVDGTVDGVSANSAIAIAIDITEDQHHDVDELPVGICEETLSISHIYSRWNLWQMLDSVLPTGGFAHSYGLEAAVQAQIIPNPEALEAFAVNTLENTGSLLLPFVYRGNRFPNIEDWIKIDQILHATLTNGVARKASISQGSALLRVASTVFVEIPELKHMRECARKPAATRLNLIGPLESASIQHRIFKVADRILKRHMNHSIEEANQTAPLLDTVQGCHDYLFSRLFRS